ncbi:MAG: TadE/TadG family type IV pilus assembly protein [Myxococcaceae bacterium]
MMRVMERTQAPRGQTMALFALSMLLLVFMVMITLSLGTRVKERIELQTVADAAAYSGAVMTARTYNTIAVLNRVNIAHMVAAAGTQSLNSWMSALISATGRSYGLLDDWVRYRLVPQAALGNFCAQFTMLYINGVINPVDAYQLGLMPLSRLTWELGSQGALFVRDDVALARDVGRRFAAGNALFLLQTVESLGILRGHLDDQDLGDEIGRNAVAGTKYPTEIVAPPGADAVSLDESGVDLPVGIPAGCQGPVCWPPAYIPDEIAMAAMGTRGYSFVTGRADGNIIRDRLSDLLNDGTGAGISVFPRYFQVIVPTGNLFAAEGTIFSRTGPRITLEWEDYRGSTYWSNLPYASHASPALLGMMGMFMFSDDHGRLRLRIRPFGILPTAAFPLQLFPIPCSGGIIRPRVGGGFPPGPGWVNFGASVASTGLPVGALHTIDRPSPEFGPAGMWLVSYGAFILPNALRLGEGAHWEVLGPANHRTGFAFMPWLYAIPPLLTFNYTQLNEPDNNFGQPKLYSLIERDYGVRAATAPRSRDPWDFIDYTASLGGSGGERFSQTATEGGNASAAFATGMAYYHRSGTAFGEHWEEPPNFLNPRWRATLVSPDIEALERRRMMGGGSDIRQTLQASNNPEAVRVFDALNAISPNVGGERHLIGAQ